MHLAKDRTYDRIDDLSREFGRGSPFPHVVIEGGLADADPLLSDFPAPEWVYAPGSEGVAQAPARVVVPKAGTMVIFRTDDRSAHGFNRPISDGKWRRSVALYYYTSEEAPNYSGDTNTYWWQDREQPRLRRIRQRAYSALIFVSRSVAFLAHRIDPKVKARS